MLAVLAGGGLLLPLVVPWQPHLPLTMAWLLDLAVHWQWLWLALLGLALALCALGRAWRWLGLAALAALPGWMASDALAPAGPAGPVGMIGQTAGTASMPARDAPFTVASANVHLDNTDAAPLLRWVRALQADVVVVLEVSPALAPGLEAAGDFPHRHLLPADNPFGIALLSRHPLRDVQVVRLRAGPLAVQAVVEAPGGPVHVTALHTMPPIVGPAGLVMRDLDIAELVDQAAATGLPAVVAGDLNATAWSSGLRVAEARHFVRAQGLAPTWPVPLASVMGIPIDHVLADRRRWRVQETGRGPDLGSDHRPVYARLRREAEAPARR